MRRRFIENPEEEEDFENFEEENPLRFRRIRRRFEENPSFRESTEKPISLEEIEDKVGHLRCHFCEGHLGAAERYPHEGGILVRDYGNERQWVYLTCLNCGHQWALHYLLSQLETEQEEKREMRENPYFIHPPKWKYREEKTRRRIPYAENADPEKVAGAWAAAKARREERLGLLQKIRTESPYLEENPVDFPVKGEYIHQRLIDPKQFDPRSFRVRPLRRAPGFKATYGCPRGQWSPSTYRCKVPMKMQSMLRPYTVTQAKRAAQFEKIKRSKKYKTLVSKMKRAGYASPESAALSRLKTERGLDENPYSRIQIKENLEDVGIGPREVFPDGTVKEIQPMAAQFRRENPKRKRIHKRIRKKARIYNCPKCKNRLFTERTLLYGFPKHESKSFLTLVCRKCNRWYRKPGVKYKI